MDVSTLLIYQHCGHLLYRFSTFSGHQYFKIVGASSSKLPALGNVRKKQAFFALHCSRLCVTLTSPKLLALGNVRKKASSFARNALVFT